jgi:hypothetical protein
MPACQGAVNAQPAQQKDEQRMSQLKEVLTICTHMDMYTDFAATVRDKGVPEDAATNMVAETVQKNLKLPSDVLAPFIAVIKDLYHRIYADPSLKRGMFDEAIFSACSNYRGYVVDKPQLRKELGNYVQSAFNPLARVTLCTKAGETAGNIGVARDKGVSKAKILEVAQKGLENDPATLALLPELVDEVYGNQDIEIAALYLYNVRRCESRKADLQFPPLSGLAEATKACLKNSEKNVRRECLSKLYSSNTGKAP